MPSESGFKNAQLHSRQRLAHGVGAKRLEIIHRQHGAGFGQTISIRHGNSEIVEKLQRRRLHERAAGKHGPQFSAEGLVYLAQQLPAQAHIGTPAGEAIC